jgi:hypothetical protein
MLCGYDGGVRGRRRLTEVGSGRRNRRRLGRGGD